MAETRSMMLLNEAAVREAEEVLGSRFEAIAEQYQKLDESFAKLRGAIRLISDTVSNTSPSGHLQQQRLYLAVSTTPETVYPSSEVVCGHRSGMNSTCSAVTRLSKLDFHRFSGDRVREWLFKLEQFFSLDFTPEELKVRIASSHFDGAATKWHQSLFDSDFGVKLLSDWKTYKLVLQEHFAEVLDDTIAELQQLKETNGIEEYHKKFELLRTRVNLTEDYLVRAYLDGLQPDTQENVQMFQPQTVNQCFLVGRLYEQVHPLKRDSEMKVEEEKEVAELEVKTEVKAGVEKKSIDKMTHEAILKEELFPQFQVPVSNLEPSFRICNASPTVCEEFSYTYAMVGIDQVQFHSCFECVNGKDSAYHVFDKMLLSKTRLQKQRKLGLSPKSWKFKYKKMTLRRRLPQNAHYKLKGGMIIKQLHRKILIIGKDGEDYEEGAQPLNVTSLFAGPSLSNFQVDHFSHKDIESSEEKQSIQQEIFVEVDSLVKQHQLNCGRDVVLAMDHGGSSPYVKLETGSYLEPDSISELELESTESKMETNYVAQPHVSIFVMESIHQHKRLGNFDIHMVSEDQKAVVAVALSPLFNDSYLEVAEFCEQSTCVKSHKRKNRLTSKSWMFKYKRDNMKLHIPTMSKNVRMVVFRKMEAEEMIQPLAADGGQEGPLEMDMQDSEVAIIEVLRRVMMLFQNSMVHHQPTVNEQDKEHHIMCLDKSGDWWSGIAQFRKPATSSFLYEEIIMVKEQLSHNSLVIQEVMRNKKIKFLKRWWFKYKSVEEGLKRMSSKLCKTYYFAVWHCWKRKTLPHISFFSLQYFQRIDTIMI